MNLEILLTVIGLAILDSLSPSIFGVQIYLLSSQNGFQKSILHTLGVFLTYFIFGLILYFSLDFIFDIVSTNFLLRNIFYLFELMAGLFLVQSALWQFRNKSKSQDLITKLSGQLFVVFMLGFISTLSDLPSSIAYLSSIIILNQSQIDILNSVALILIYNLVYIFPLLSLILIAKLGQKNSIIKKLSDLNHKYNHLIIAYTSLILGILIWLDGVYSILFRLG